MKRSFKFVRLAMATGTNEIRLPAKMIRSANDAWLFVFPRNTKQAATRTSDVETLEIDRISDRIGNWRDFISWMRNASEIKHTRRHVTCNIKPLQVDELENDWCNQCQSAITNLKLLEILKRRKRFVDSFDWIHFIFALSARVHGHVIW